MIITSPTNNKVKQISALLRQPKARRMSADFVVEGLRMAAEVPPALLRELCVSESFSKKAECRALLVQFPDAEPVIFADPVFAKLSDTVHPQGVLALVQKPSYEIAKLPAGSPLSDPEKEVRLLILENVQDPGNVGTMLRTAEAAGIDAVFLSSTCADLFNPKTTRSTMGAIFRVPFFTYENTKELIAFLHKKKVSVFAAALEGSAEYTKTSYGRRAAVVIGNEGNGLLPETVAAADAAVRIPMDGQVESLNASVSAALLMYELRRNRR